MGGVILGFNGQRQGFDGAQVEIGHLLDVALLVVQLGEVQAVGTVDQVHGRED